MEPHRWKCHLSTRPALISGLSGMSSGDAHASELSEGKAWGGRQQLASPASPHLSSPGAAGLLFQVSTRPSEAVGTPCSLQHELVFPKLPAP